MKKQSLLKVLILVTTVLSSTVEAFATASAVQTLSVSASPTVSITKTTSYESGQINPATGVHEGLNASFEISTNGTDENYTFIVGSKIIAQGNEELSAFSDDGKALLFGRYDREEYLPTKDAIDNAKLGGNNNPNVIAYPITSMTITAPMQVHYNAAQLNLENNAGCYVVILNGGHTGTLQQIIGGSPYGSTYTLGQDTAGQYKAVVYFTAISK